MVEHQQLRFFRTTLLGRTPGWSPPAPPVGPWRDVRFCTDAHSPRLVSFSSDYLGGTGSIRVKIELPDARGSEVLHVSHDGSDIGCTTLSACGNTIEGSWAGEVDAWWPHTHGRPALYDLSISGVSGRVARQPLARIGFRRIAAVTADGRFDVLANDRQVFCRGACWTPIDTVSLQNEPAKLYAALLQVRDAGFNMLRVAGPFVYETESFHSICDELGIMVWQDMMFANMDYPMEDETFRNTCIEESRQHLKRLSPHPSTAIICGNSEVSQQAAMWGAERTSWSPAFFATTLPELVESHLPGTSYWPSSAFGRGVPHQPDNGTCSYYGVGAYMRPVDDLRRSRVRFATECLAFANVPDPGQGDVPGGGTTRAHQPLWKQRSPRDLGAGWDFDDVRDFYFREIYDLDPHEVRRTDHERYLQLSRRVSAEIMSLAFSEWRSAESCCGGAIVWFLRDLWPGAGWGIVDAAGRPKAAWYQLRRLLQPVSISMTDEGLNGLHVNLVNESNQTHRGHLEVELFRDGRQSVGRAGCDVVLRAGSRVETITNDLFDHFFDSTYAYRFGPLASDLVVARFKTEGHDTRKWDCHFLPKSSLFISRAPDVHISTEVSRLDESRFALSMFSSSFVRSVYVSAGECDVEDQYFSILPGETRVVEITLRKHGAIPRGWIDALNLPHPVSFSGAS